MALVIAILFGLGYVLDAWLDTRPVFMIALSVFAMVGVSIRYWLAYNRRMDAAEEERRKAVYG